MTTDIFALNVDQNSSNISILQDSYIFFDKKNSYNIKTIKDNLFQKNSKEVISYGFVPKSSVWIKFTLKNISDHPLKKVLEYSNSNVEDISLYYDKKVVQDGMFHISQNRFSIYPSFEITLKPYEEKTFYINAYCKISTLIAELHLYDKYHFIKHNDNRKSYIFIFFASILTLFIYNFMLLIFTKDKAYLYYFLYLFSVIFFQANYLGVLQLYLYSKEITIFVTDASMIYISFLIVTIILFTREFLNTSQFKKIDLFLKIYLYITPVIALLSFNNFIFNMNIIAFFIPLGIIVVFLGFYALFHGVVQAKYYVIGWSFVVSSLIFINLKTLGIYDISKYFAYLSELSFLLEALLFSIALAHRIKILAEEKNKIDKELIEFQKEQQHKLENLVEQKTKDLSSSLQEKEILYKELNHRVKNNLQMILSLIKLQISRSDSTQTKNELQVTLNRITSVSDLYEKLLLQDNSNKIDTLQYFKKIVQNIEFNFEKDIKIKYDIQFEPNIDEIIYCGLILNELVTNSFKYAFIKDGKINIKLYKEKNGDNIFAVEDDGVGYKDRDQNSLGLSIVEALIEKQLFGKLNIDTTKGTKIMMRWK